MDTRTAKQKRIDDQVLIHNLASFVPGPGNLAATVFTGATAPKGKEAEQAIQALAGSTVGGLGGGTLAGGATYGGIRALEKILGKSVPKKYEILAGGAVGLASLLGAGKGSQYAIRKLMGYDEE